MSGTAGVVAQYRPDVVVPTYREDFSSAEGGGLDVVQHQDGLHDGGGPAEAAAQFGEQSPGLEDGDGALDGCPDPGMIG